MPNRYPNPWTIERLRIAFDRYVGEHGHLPTATEIDDCEYLPSARQIQRAFGGLRNVRTELGYADVDFGRGDYRRKIVSQISKTGRRAETVVGDLLIRKFGALFVHQEAHYAPHSRSRVDYFVYTQNKNFGVEVFYTQDKRNCSKMVRMKLAQYSDYPRTEELYLVHANDLISQSELDAMALSNANFANFANIELINLHTLSKVIDKYTPLETPSGYRGMFDVS